MQPAHPSHPGELGVADFTAALVAMDGQAVPPWVAQELAGNGIAFVSGECLTKADLIKLAADANVVWVFGGSTVLTADCLPSLPKCLAILRTGNGTDNIPLAAATAVGIVVAVTPQAGGDTVADHTLALILAVLRQVTSQDRLVRAGVWDRDRAWPRAQLRGETLGLIGFGSIARAIVRRLVGFDLSILAYDPFVPQDVFERHGVEQRSLDDVISSSRIVSLHCPLTEDTYRLIGRRELRLMRPDAILINTARGLVVDEEALYKALSERWISGAGLDVMESEPPDPGNPLLALDNVIITPHIAAYSDAFWPESWRQSVDAIVNLAQGRWPDFCANPAVIPRRPLNASGNRRPSISTTISTTPSPVDR
jgi:D-3-phosphoglycerate dehydrogenase / 2-oxoglutarate reductase